MRTNTSWERFLHDGVREVLTPGSRVLDIGAGLRIDRDKGNVEDPSRAWIKPLLERVTYEVMDPVATYHPDIIGDIKQMPVEDGVYDAVICLAVLEHVDKPWVAAAEIHRVLKPGGILLCYVPFLYPYHAMEGYYGDYFRYTETGLRSLFDQLTDFRFAPVRGPAETLANMFPGRISRSVLMPMARWVDARRPGSGRQVSGYYMIAKKPNNR